MSILNNLPVAWEQPTKTGCLPQKPQENWDAPVNFDGMDTNNKQTNWRSGAPQLNNSVPTLSSTVNIPTLNATLLQPENQTPRIKARRTKRQQSHKLRKVLKQVTSNKSARYCGLALERQMVAVKLSGTPGSHNCQAGFSGIQRCGSVWICPVCAPRIHQHRGIELERALVKNQELGGSAALMTLTMRHKYDSLRDDNGKQLTHLWDALSTAWAYILNGKTWQDIREKAGVLGMARFVEMTHGKEGWHIHIHAVVFFDSITPKWDALQEFTDHCFTRWANKLVKMGLKAPIKDRGGFDFTWLSGTRHTDAALPKYLTKTGNGSSTAAEALDAMDKKELKKLNSYLNKRTRGLAAEATGWGGGKIARGTNRTPWAILTDFLSEADERDLFLWQEYEKAAYGRRFSTWSSRKRNVDDDDLWNLILDARGDTVSDQEIVDDENPDAEPIAFIEGTLWNHLNNLQSFNAGDLLTAAETSGIDGIRHYLSFFDVRMEEVRERLE